MTILCMYVYVYECTFILHVYLANNYRSIDMEDLKQ